MKRFISLFLSLFLLVMGCTGCGTSGIESGEAQVDETPAEEQAVETHYTENQTEMGNYMNAYYAYISNGWVYTIGWGANTSKPLFLKMRTDGTDDSPIHYYEMPKYINVKGEYIYAVLEGEDSSNIYRYRLGGEEEKLLVENAYYFRIIDNSIYYCETAPKDSEKMTKYMKCDMDGKNAEVVFDKEIYFPYLVDNLLYYQDDADNETIHVYNIESKEDKRITDHRTYQYVLNDDYMYCIEYDGPRDEDNEKQGKLCKVNLNTLEREVLYVGAVDGSLAVYEDKLFFINENDESRLYSIDKNGENIVLVTQDNYCWAPCIYGDKMIYMDAADNYEYVDNIYICNLDGSDKVSLKKEY